MKHNSVYTAVNIYVKPDYILYMMCESKSKESNQLNPAPSSTPIPNLICLANLCDYAYYMVSCFLTTRVQLTGKTALGRKIATSDLLKFTSSL